MERRSARGSFTPGKKTSEATASTTSKSGLVGMKTPGKAKVNSKEVTGGPTEIDYPGESGSEEPEVTLNSRGRPARQIKRNRFYFDGDNVNDDTAIWKQTPKATPKKVKQEPVEVDDEPDDSASTSYFHTETEATPRKGPVVKGATGSVVKGGTGSASKPSHAQVAQAMAASVGVKSKQSPGRPHKSGVSTLTPRKSIESMPTPAKKAETPKTLKQAPLKITIRQETSKVTPRKSETPKSAGKSERQHHSTPAKDDSPRETIKIKKERDTDLIMTVPMELSDRDRLKEKHSRERRDSRREKVRYGDDQDHGTASYLKAKRRSSMNDSIENTLALTEAEGTTVDVKPTLDKKTAQEISLRLRNLLKLPKAHKWVCYEWFYSNVDKVLFEGENDFQICFRESFPQLKARKLTRVEWTNIRRLMGKPRRCSQSFFDEEREELARRRQKIRMIQQRKITDLTYKELPDEIPLQLVIGTKVTARLRRPQDGLFTGSVEGVDTSNYTYRISFDRPGLGTHSIPDYEVLSNEQPETVSVSSFALKVPRRSYGAFSGGQFKFQNMPGTDEHGGFPKSPFPVDGMLGGFPIRLLDMIVRLSKLLKAKREKILQLKELNVEAEKMRSYEKTFNSDFRYRYAQCVLDLCSMNREMTVYLDGVQQYCLEIAPDHGSNQMIIPEHIQEHCDHEAGLIVSNCNSKLNRMPVQNPKAMNLITKLASIMLQVKTLSSGDRNLYEVKSIKDSLKEIKASLEGQNIQLFQDKIEIPMNRIQAGLTTSR